MNKRPQIDLEDFDALFSTDEDAGFYSDIVSTDKSKYPVMEIPLEDLHPFKNHPFHVAYDKSMENLMDSIQKNGILHPGIVRKMPDGGYEIISGHRRHMACSKLGMQTMPVRVLQLDDAQAVVCMTDANFQQRENMLISEKAKAYRMRRDALRYKRGEKSGTTLEKIGKESGDSSKTVNRLIRISYLTDNMMDLVDRKKIPLLAGVDISYLDEEAQHLLYGILIKDKVYVTNDQAKKLRAAFEEHVLNEQIIESILFTKKNSSKKICLSESFLHRYFKSGQNEKDIEETLIRAMELLKLQGGE